VDNLLGVKILHPFGGLPELSKVYDEPKSTINSSLAYHAMTVSQWLILSRFHVLFQRPTLHPRRDQTKEAGRGERVLVDADKREDKGMLELAPYECFSDQILNMIVSEVYLDERRGALCGIPSHRCCAYEASLALRTCPCVRP
jgi:hypothetical protein